MSVQFTAGEDFSLVTISDTAGCAATIGACLSGCCPAALSKPAPMAAAGSELETVPVCLCALGRSRVGSGNSWLVSGTQCRPAKGKVLVRFSESLDNRFLDFLTVKVLP